MRNAHQLVRVIGVVVVNSGTRKDIIAALTPNNHNLSRICECVRVYAHERVCVLSVCVCARARMHACACVSMYVCVRKT